MLSSSSYLLQLSTSAARPAVPPPTKLLAVSMLFTRKRSAPARSLVGRRRRQVSLGRGGASASWMKRPKASSFATGGMTGRAAIVESWRQRRPHGPIIQVQKARFFEPRKIRVKEADFSSEKSRRVFWPLFLVRRSDFDFSEGAPNNPRGEIRVRRLA